jgi:30S ribosomal protein S7
VLLKVVTFAGNVDRTFLLVGKTHTGDLSQSGVGLLGRSRGDGQTNAALLRAVIQNRALGLERLLLSAFLDELVDGRHF